MGTIGGQYVLLLISLRIIFFRFFGECLGELMSVSECS